MDYIEKYSQEVNIAFTGMKFTLYILKYIDLNTKLYQLVHFSYRYKHLNNLSDSDFNIFHKNYMSYILNQNYLTINKNNEK